MVCHSYTVLSEPNYHRDILYKDKGLLDRSAEACGVKCARSLALVSDCLRLLD